jgi:hypothetical protein
MRGSDGGETWDVVIADSAVQRLAKFAGASEGKVSWLKESLAFMMFELLDSQREKSNRAPSWSKRIEHYRTMISLARRLEMLLAPEWVAAEMRNYEAREVRQEIFGTRGLFKSDDAQKIRAWSETGAERLEGVMRDVEGVTRLRARLSTMIKQSEDGTLAQGRPRVPPPPSALNPAKQYIANYALAWWNSLGHGEERTKGFIAFAGALYQLAGLPMRTGIAAQLTSAVKRSRTRVGE